VQNVSITAGTYDEIAILALLPEILDREFDSFLRY